MDGTHARTIVAGPGPLIALVGCNGADDGKAAQADPSASAAASAPASPPEQAPTTAAPAPQESSQAPAAEQAPPPAAPAGHPAVGTWQSPLKNGKRAHLIIRSDGGLQLNTAGFVCSGRATPDARTFQIQVTQCVAPIPVVVGTVSPDGKSMTVVETKPSGKKSTEKWRRLLS